MPRKRTGISRITVQGYKSLHSEQSIEIRPLTLLAGANSSGKSSIMQPLLLLKQTLEASTDPGALLLDGPNVRFTSADQLLSHNGGEGRGRFSVSLALAEGQDIQLLFSKVPGKGRGFGVSAMTCHQGDQTIPVKPEMSQEEIAQAMPQLFKEMKQDMEKAEKGPLKWRVIQKRCFLTFELRSEKFPERDFLFSEFGLSPGAEFLPDVEGVIHLPGLRGNPERTYQKRAVGSRFPGKFEEYAASVIAQWQAEKDERLEQLGATLEALGLTWKVEAKAIGDTQVELRVGRLVHGKRGGAHDLVSIADVGFGVSQSLPVLVALLVAKAGQLVYLEQPEIHLHPKAQRELANAMRDAARRDVLVVAETHSSLLLREVQRLVAKGELSRGDVEFHWFQRAADGSTKVTPARLDETGAFGEEWPQDFDETSLASERDYLDAVEDRERKQ